jgi:hypothetical protein
MSQTVQDISVVDLTDDTKPVIDNQVVASTDEPYKTNISSQNDPYTDIELILLLGNDV